jgi:hypothetical protein
MKKLKLVIFIFHLCSSFMNGQFSLDSIPVADDGYVRYERIFDQSGTKDQRYTKTKAWIADTTKTVKTLIETDDKTFGILVAKCSMLCKYDLYMSKNKNIEKLNWQGTSKIDFTLKIYLKDKMTEVIVTDIDLPIKGMPPILTNYGTLKIYAARQLLNSDQDNFKTTGMSELSKFCSVHTNIIAMMEDIRNTLLR